MIIKKLKSALKAGNVDRIRSVIKKINVAKSSPETLLEGAYYLFKDADGFEKDALRLLDKGISKNHDYADKAYALVREPFIEDDDGLKEKILSIGLRYDPDEFSNNLEMALIYIRQEKFQQAEEKLLALLERRVRYEPLVNLSDLYLKMNRHHDAIACAELATEVSPDPVIVNYNLGIVYMTAARYKDAILAFEKVLQVDPTHNDARLSVGQLLIKSGMFTLGWEHFEYRWNDTQKINQIDLPLPRWKGESLAGKGLIVWGDQGLGDSIMYAGLLNRLIAAGCRVTVVCTRRLENLFTASFDLETYYPHGENETVNISGNYQYQISFGSLPAVLLHSFEDFGDGAAYLNADGERMKLYRQMLRQRFAGKLLIGFTWRGGLSHTRKFARDTGLDIWAAMMANPNVQFVNLQYGTTADEEEKICSMGGYVSELDCKNDIDGLAAMISALDLVISADNTTVHLAGALGAPVWTLLPFSSEWRWFFEESKTYWYQSMRLFHQQQLNDWQGCFNQVEQSLIDLISQAQQC